jgi:hypothetical protein
MSISIISGITNESWTLPYDGEEVKLEVKKPGYHHTLFISNRNGFRNRHPWEVFFRLLNELVWYYSIRVQDINGSHGQFCANANFLPHEDSYAIRLSGFKQKVFEENKHLALGFFREGTSSGSAYYAFMCYAKILEIPFKDGRSKGDWIDQEIPKLTGQLAISFRDRRVHMLGEKTLGMWLKEDGRDALSHANIQSQKVVRDPNSYNDWSDIKWGNEVMRELAERVIIEKLGVPAK